MPKMTQIQAIVETLKKLGGVATLTQINNHIFEFNECEWKGKTPFATIRCYMQRKTELFYKIRPGMYGLVDMRKQIEENGIVAQTESNKDSKAVTEFNHTYYQGLLLEIGNRQHLLTYSPNQDKNKKFGGNKTLGEIRSCDVLPQFTTQKLMKRAETIDVMWLDKQETPYSFFEVEHSTDIYNSLLKYNALRSLSAKMIIVADGKRKHEFESKIKDCAFDLIEDRVKFLDYKSLERQYDIVLEYQAMNVGILGL